MKPGLKKFTVSPPKAEVLSSGPRPQGRKSKKRLSKAGTEFRQSTDRPNQGLSLTSEENSKRRFHNDQRTAGKMSGFTSEEEKMQLRLIENCVVLMVMRFQPYWLQQLPADSRHEPGDSIPRHLFSMRLKNALTAASQRGYTVWNEDEEDSTSSSSEGSNESVTDVSETDKPMCFDLPLELEGSEVREYIENTVGEPLLFAMATVERERPDNPIEFIAEYLLQFKVLAEEEKARIDKAIRKTDVPLSIFTQIIREDRL